MKNGTDTRSNRYSRQILFSPIGDEGQRRIGASRVLLVGCGALGSHIADMMVRAGVGSLTIVDRDYVQWSNLQRQTLFTEQDAETSANKAKAAAAHLAKINSEVEIRGIVADFGPSNAPDLVGGVDVVMDGTDNLDTRYAINGAAVKRGIPYVYAGVVGTAGMEMPIVNNGPCLRCLFPDPPAPDQVLTCNEVGVLASAVEATAAYAVTDALRILTGQARKEIVLTQFDLWSGAHARIAIQPAADCPTCGGRSRAITTTTAPVPVEA